MVCEPSTACALTTVSRIMLHALHQQHARYLRGDFTPISYLSNLVRVHGLIRFGICRRTKQVEMTEMPDLTRDLNALPTEYRIPIVTAIRFEQTGRGHTGTTGVLTRQGF